MNLKQLQNLEKCRIGPDDHLSLLHVGVTVNILETCCVALPSHLWIGPGTWDLSKHPQSLNRRHRVWEESPLWHLRPCVLLTLLRRRSWSFTRAEGVAMASSRGGLEIPAGHPFLVALWTGTQPLLLGHRKHSRFHFILWSYRGFTRKKENEKPTYKYRWKIPWNICEPVQSSSAVRCTMIK